jgi:membrane dipeptidase
MTLTHTRNLAWAGSSAEKDDRGLDALGRRIIAEMNRLGMMVDVAHVSDKTFWDVIETSRAPVFSSHSSARALSNIPRNLGDDMIRAVARKGGLVMVNLGCEFISQRSADTSPWINPSLPKDAPLRTGLARRGSRPFRAYPQNCRRRFRRPRQRF